MTDTVPGYRVSIEVFLPADPDQPRQMAEAAAALDNLHDALTRIGLPNASVSFRFIARHRISSPPAASPAVTAPTLEPTHQAPAQPAEAGAATECADCGGDGQILTDSGWMTDCPSCDGKNKPACAHQPGRRKSYGNGTVVCLDCQAQLAAGAA